MPRGIPNRRIYTMQEMAEDAGHMGYTHDYYPGSPEWNRRHNIKQIVNLVDTPPTYKNGELFDTSKF